MTAELSYHDKKGYYGLPNRSEKTNSYPKIKSYLKDKILSNRQKTELSF
jgi:hypothetical protein